jgi:membrane-associated phospholipid phosphatase
MTQLPPSTVRKVTNHWPSISGAAAVVLTVALGLLVALRPTPYGFDAEWMEEIGEYRNSFWEVPAFVMNYIGGGWVAVLLVPVGGALLLYALRGKWTAIYYLGVSALSGLLVQVLKNLFGRARPDDFLLEIGSPSFPSGHAANAATLAVTLALILGRWWVWVAGALYTLMMAISRTYLGVHWLSDTLGGVLLGAGIAFILWPPFATRLKAEAEARHTRTGRARLAW